jgi:valyl-tRNA synthetase
MSKTRGNVIDPLEIFEQYGTDAVRFTLAAAAAPGSDISLQYSKLETHRNFCNKIWNAARFVQMNCPPDEAPTATVSATPSLVDRWFTSVLNRTIADVNRNLGEYRFHEAAVTLYHFFWHDFCDWYIELSKAAVTAKEPTPEQAAARHRLITALETSLRLLHPFMPFITEEIWQRLPHDGETICLAAYPAADESLIDVEAEGQMDAVIEIIQKVRNIRAVMNIDQSRQVDLLLHPASEAAGSLIADNSDHIRQLARVAAIEITGSLGDLRHVARDVVGEIEIAVPLEGLIDFEKEKERLTKNLDKIEKEIGQLGGRLSNPDFISRAAEDVVAETRERHDELVEKREKLNAILQGM